MNRIMIHTIHNNTKPFWLITLMVDNQPQEFCVYSPDIDTAIYEVLTSQNASKSAIVSISRH